MFSELSAHSVGTLLAGCLMKIFYFEIVLIMSINNNNK